MGDSAFPAPPWLLKAYPDTTKNQKEVYFNKTLRAARVVSEHAYGMLKGRWRLIYKKTESRRRNIKAVIMACIALHNLCIARSDLCIPRWQLRVENLDLICNVSFDAMLDFLSQKHLGDLSVRILAHRNPVAIFTSNRSLGRILVADEFLVKLFCRFGRES